MQVKIVGGHGGVSPDFKATSYLIDGKLLIDAGSVASGLKTDEQILIDNIIISHSHLDHICELAYLCDNCFGLRKQPFEVYSNSEVINSIKTHLMNDYIWPDFSKIPNEINPTVRFNTFEIEKVIELDGYKILPIKVNHPAGGTGFIVEKKNKAVLFTQDTGPTERIWEIAKQFKNLKAIFCEVSFPNSMEKVAIDSFHHTPKSISEEIKKMPADIPIFLGHLKPNFQAQLYKEVDELDNDRITILGSDNTSFII